MALFNVPAGAGGARLGVMTLVLGLCIAFNMQGGFESTRLDSCSLAQPEGETYSATLPTYPVDECFFDGEYAHTVLKCILNIILRRNPETNSNHVHKIFLWYTWL